MKANYLTKSRSKGKHLKWIFVFLSVFLLSIFVLSFFRAGIISTVSPFWKMENAFASSLRNSIAFFQTQKALMEENASLKERLSSLEIKILSMSRESVQENFLLELAGRRPETGAFMVAVLTHPPQTPYDVIVIDAGANDSVSVGSEVFLPEGPLLGVVSEVFPKTAKVKLFSASGEEKNAVLEKNKMPEFLTGIGGGNFKLILPRDIMIEKGDRIVSSDITSRLLATAEEITVRPTDSFKEVLAKSPTNIFALRFVFVTP